MAGIEHVALGSRRIDGQAAEGRGAELGKRSINTSRSGIARVVTSSVAMSFRLSLPMTSSALLFCGRRIVEGNLFIV